MRLGRLMAAAGICALPITAFAQPAREANIYNGLDHQPTAGAVHSQEQSVGVAPSRQREDAENHDLAVMSQQLQQKAERDAKTVPDAKTNVYGVQPGGIIQITPNGGGNGAASGSGGH